MMKSNYRVLTQTLVVIVLGWSSAAYAGCTGAQVTGIWEVAFSDGSSCRLRLVLGGEVDVEKSICYDPDRGTSALDSGTIKVNGQCFAEGLIVVGGVSVELPVQFSQDRGMAAGRFRIAASGAKGSVVMVRVP